MIERPDSIVDYYRQRAPEYEQIYFRDHPQKQKELAEEAERLRALSSGKSVLDLACGTGYWTEVIAGAADETVASDISPEMIQQARAKKYARPVSFVRTDLYQGGFAEGSFDLLTLGFWFSHEPRQNHREFFRLIVPPLKKGGLIWMIDNNPPAEGPAVESEGKDSHGNNYKKRFLDSGKAFVILKNYFVEKELREIFGRHFKIERLIFGQCYWSVVLAGR